jgi:hypothetical protein
MEAAGIYDFPCLVVRGINYYSDSHKSNLWKNYASAMDDGSGVRKATFVIDTTSGGQHKCAGLSKSFVLS